MKKRRPTPIHEMPTPSEYSKEAREWAIREGIIIGDGTVVNGEPNYMWTEPMTREQFVTALYRYHTTVSK